MTSVEDTPEVNSHKRTLEEKQVAAIERLNRALRLGFAELNMSELNSTGRIKVLYRSAEVIDFPLEKALRH